MEDIDDKTEKHKNTVFHVYYFCIQKSVHHIDYQYFIIILIQGDSICITNNYCYHT